MESFLMSTATMLVALAAVLALAWLVLRVMRGRMGGASLSGPGTRGAAPLPALRVLRALPVGARERVVLVEHGGERWLLGVTAGGISTVAHWPAGPDAAEAGAPVSADSDGDPRG